MSSTSRIPANSSSSSSSSPPNLPEFTSVIQRQTETAVRPVFINASNQPSGYLGHKRDRSEYESSSSSGSSIREVDDLPSICKSPLKDYLSSRPFLSFLQKTPEKKKTDVGSTTSPQKQSPFASKMDVTKTAEQGRLILENAPNQASNCSDRKRKKGSHTPERGTLRDLPPKKESSSKPFSFPVKQPSGPVTLEERFSSVARLAAEGHSHYKGFRRMDSAVRVKQKARTLRRAWTVLLEGCDEQEVLTLNKLFQRAYAWGSRDPRWKDLFRNNTTPVLSPPSLEDKKAFLKWL